MIEAPYVNIQELIGQHKKIYYTFQVQYDVKVDKYETRYLAVTKYRLILLTCKPLKEESSFSFLDISSLEFKSPKMICIGDEIRKIKLILTKGDFWPVIFRITETLLHIYPNFNFEKRITNLDLSSEFKTKLMTYINQISSNLCHSFCGNFSTLFKAKCDYFSVNYMEDVAWDVENIYYSNDCHEFDFMDFNNLSSRSLLPLISALECNDWFTAINFSNIKMTTEMTQELVKIYNCNNNIEKLILINSASKDAIQRLLMGLSKSSKLTYLDLSSNLLDDKGISLLTSYLSRRPSCLKELHLSKMALNSRSLNQLIESLASSPADHVKAFHCLDISENYVKGEEIGALNLFLPQCTCLIELNFSNTEMSLENLFGVLLRGPVISLKILNVSGCHVFSGKKTTGNLPNSWMQFFSSASRLETCSFANVKITPEALKMIFDGLKNNGALKNLTLVLSGCNIGQNCCTVLDKALSSITNISSFDISDNALDQQLSTIIGKFSQNKVIKELFIGKNISTQKPKLLAQLAESISQLVQDDFLTIENLHIDNLKLRNDTITILNALGHSTLKSINISGNMMGDFGAKMLGKALQINSILEVIQLDNNQISPDGFHEISMALNRNFTLKKMNLPLNDMAVAVKSNYDKMEKAVKNIEACLQRNISSGGRLIFDQEMRVQYCLEVYSHQKSLEKNINEGNLLLQKLDDLLHMEAVIDDPTKIQIDQCKSIFNEASKLKDFHHEMGSYLKLENNFSGTLVDKMQSDILKLQEDKLEKYSSDIAEYIKSLYPLLSEEKPIKIKLDNDKQKEQQNFDSEYLFTCFDNNFIKNVSKVTSNFQLTIYINMLWLTKKKIDFLIELTDRLNFEMIKSGKFQFEDADSLDGTEAIKRKPKTQISEDKDKISDLNNSSNCYNMSKKKPRPPSLLESYDFVGYKDHLTDKAENKGPIPLPRRNKNRLLNDSLKIDDEFLEILIDYQTDNASNNNDKIINAINYGEDDTKSINNESLSLVNDNFNILEQNLIDACTNKHIEMKLEKEDSNILRPFSSNIFNPESEGKVAEILSPKSFGKSFINKFKKVSIKENDESFSKKLNAINISKDVQKLEHKNLDRPKKPNTRAPTKIIMESVGFSEEENIIYNNGYTNENVKLNYSDSSKEERKITVSNMKTLFPSISSEESYTIASQIKQDAKSSNEKIYQHSECVETDEKIKQNLIVPTLAEIQTKQATLIEKEVIKIDENEKSKRSSIPETKSNNSINSVLRERPMPPVKPDKQRLSGSLKLSRKSNTDETDKGELKKEIPPLELGDNVNSTSINTESVDES